MLLMDRNIERTFPVFTGGGVINVTCWPGRVFYDDQGRPRESVVEAIVSAVSSWDLLESDDGKMVPISVESVQDLPAALLSAIAERAGVEITIMREWKGVRIT